MSRLQEQAEKWRYQCIKLKNENDKLKEQLENSDGAWKIVIYNLRLEIEKGKKQLLLSESQNYCKMCSNTLDGYTPKERPCG